MANYRKNNFNRIVTIVLLVLFVVIGILAVMYYYQSAAKAQANNMANANMRTGKIGEGMTNGGTLEVMFFNVDWCPHCKTAIPDWTTFVNKYDGETVNGYLVTCVGGVKGVNCTNTDDPDVKSSLQKFKIQHYPTLIFVQNGNNVEFDAKINTKNLDDFMNSLN